MKEPGVPAVDEFLNLKGRVLRTLIQWGMPLPMSRIAKEIGSNYVTVRKHLRYLEEAGLIASVDYGKIYRSKKNFRFSPFFYGERETP